MTRLLTVMSFVLGAVPVVADEALLRQSWWPQFRGPNGGGVAAQAKELPVSFGPSKNVVWKTRLPHGHSSPCVWKNRIFLTGFAAQQKRLETLCIDRPTGKILWRRAAPAEKIETVHEISSPATPTPATDGQRVFVYFGSYGLLCYDFDGREQWKRPLPIPNLYFGTGASPIVAGPFVLLNIDQQGDSHLFAVDRATGETAWKKERLSFQRGWSTPVHVRHDGIDQVVVLGGRRLVAYDLKDGRERWWVDGMPPFPITTPVVGQDRLYLAVSDEYGEPDNVVQPPAFEDFAKRHDKNKDGKIAREEIPPEFIVIDRRASQGAGDVTLRGWFFRSVDRDKDGALNRREWDKFAKRMAEWPTQFHQQVLAVRLGGRGDVTKTHIAWQDGKGVPEVPSPLYYQDRIYTVKNGGIVFCRDATTGKVVFRGRLGAIGGYYASPVAGDGKVYAASDRGVIIVFRAGDRFEVLARNDFGEPIMATPAIVNRQLYVRTERFLYAFGDGLP